MVESRRRERIRECKRQNKLHTNLSAITITFNACVTKGGMMAKTSQLLASILVRAIRILYDRKVPCALTYMIICILHGKTLV